MLKKSKNTWKPQILLFICSLFLRILQIAGQCMLKPTRIGKHFEGWSLYIEKCHVHCFHHVKLVAHIFQVQQTFFKLGFRRLSPPYPRNEDTNIDFETLQAFSIDGNIGQTV